MSKMVAGRLDGEGEVALEKMLRTGEPGGGGGAVAEGAFLGDGGCSGAVKMFSSTTYVPKMLLVDAAGAGASTAVSRPLPLAPPEPATAPNTSTSTG